MFENAGHIHVYSPGPVGLDSEKRIVSEKMRTDAKRAYKEGKRVKKMGEKRQTLCRNKNNNYYLYI